MESLSLFSERLSDLMLESKLTSEQLGAKIGVSGSAVRLWKEKKNLISLSKAVLIADYFNCSLEYLFGRSDKLIDFIVQPAPPFYDRLREIMQAKQKSRYRVCADLKKSHKHFDKWKNGADPLMYSVIELADYLSVTLDCLAGREL